MHHPYIHQRAAPMPTHGTVIPINSYTSTNIGTHVFTPGSDTTTRTLIDGGGTRHRKTLRYAGPSAQPKLAVPHTPWTKHRFFCIGSSDRDLEHIDTVNEYAMVSANRRSVGDTAMAWHGCISRPQHNTNAALPQLPTPCTVHTNAYRT